MLAKLTGYQDMSSPELTVAIRGAQKLCQQVKFSDEIEPEEQYGFSPLITNPYTTPNLQPTISANDIEPQVILILIYHPSFINHNIDLK